MQSVRLLGLLFGLQFGANPSIASYARTAAPTYSFAGVSKPATVSSVVDSVRCVTTVGKFDDNADSALTGSTGHLLTPRWQLRPSRALKVKIADASAIAGWMPAYRDEVVSALHAWGATNSPVEFHVVADSEPADISIHWVDRFDAAYDGWTTLTWELPGRIVAGDVALAVHSREGVSLSPLQRDQVMLHEIGHVLGLSHSHSAASVMRGQVEAAGISPDDTQALWDLYAAAPDVGATGPDTTGGVKAHRCAAVR